MNRRKIFYLIVIFTLILSLNGSAYAQQRGGDLSATPLTPTRIISREGVKGKGTAPVLDAGGERLVSVVVLLEDASLAAAKGGPALDARSAESQEYLAYLETKHGDFKGQVASNIPSATIVHQYKVVLNGVSLIVPESQLGAIASLPGVKAVYPDRLLQPDTEVSPGFIGAPTLWNQLGGQEDAGEGVVVGVLDTGIWPEHPSFSDPDPNGETYAPPPITPSSCDFGNTAYNPNDVPFTCNNKLIGAYAFIDTYKAIIGLLPEEFDSARDDNGHGTHTSSTAAGNGGVEASIFGVPRGTISGIAPRAHVVMYRVCADLGCFSSDSAAAVEQAILDEVDALNFSISGGSSPYSDIVSLAFLDAYNAGVFVAASAGNSGPGADTTDHREPWVATVGASTTDRHFLSTVMLGADNGDSLELIGASVTDGISTPTGVVYAGDVGDPLCEEATPDGAFTGMIVICDRGVIARVEKSYNVGQRGAVGMLLRNLALQGLATDNHFIPSVHLEVDAGDALFGFFTTHTGVTATFTAGTASTVQGDVMAAFSSRGGPGQTLGISKPDITAPGVQILAGHTPLPATIDGGLPGELFQAIQGTSMSSPHIAGSAALLAALHPDWTPGQIKSAVMMTAKTEGVTKEDGVTPADPFDYGSGRVDLSKAGVPSITISDSGSNFVAHQGDLWNANYPSLYVPVMPGEVTVERTVHNETGRRLRLRLSVIAPEDVQISVPERISVRPNSDTTFEITIDARQVPLGEVRHATLEFKRENEILHFPITIVRQQPNVTLDKSCDPATIARGDTTDCIITITNTSFDPATVSLTDQLPKQLKLIKGSVVGATPKENGVIFEGTLFAAQPPIVSVITAPWGFGSYLSLASLGVPPFSGVTDETIITLTGFGTFVYAGESYDSIDMTSNGYTVAGGTGNLDDLDFVNQSFPDPERPNNVLAPFWSDLDPGFGGALYAAILTDGVNDWLVLEWENVANFGDHELNTFQVWIGLNGVEDIWYTYGPVLSDGDGGALTIGAENAFGNSGANYYYNGTGTLPGPNGIDVQVTSIPGAPGETHIITFSARGRRVGAWTNCAEMTGDIFPGTNIACFSGEVVP